MQFQVAGETVTLRNGDQTVRCTVAEFQWLEPGFEYTAGATEMWRTDGTCYMSLNGNQQANPYNRAAYLTTEKLAEYESALAPKPEPEPEPELETGPSQARQWGELATRMNASLNWKRLVKSNGAAAELARYVSEKDVPNAREYWLFLDSEGDLSPELKAEIEAAAVDCGLGDLFAEMTAPQV